MKSLLKNNNKMKTSVNKFVVFCSAKAIPGDILTQISGNHEISSGDVTLINTKTIY